MASEERALLEMPTGLTDTHVLILTESWNHRKIWIGRDHKAHLIPTRAMGWDIFHWNPLQQKCQPWVDRGDGGAACGAFAMFFTCKGLSGMVVLNIY